MIKAELGCRIISSANRREHWGEKARRNKAQRREAMYACRAAQFDPPEGPLEIVLVRLYPGGSKPMDDDNLAAAFKAVRDGVADWLRIDDGSELLHWRYRQEMSPNWGALVLVRREGAET